MSQNAIDIAGQLAAAAKNASVSLSTAKTAQKNDALRRMAAALLSPEVTTKVLAANQRDLAAAEATGLAVPMIDRLRLDMSRLVGLAKAVAEIEALPDPVGSIAELRQRPSGIMVGRMMVPLGVILMIYESRPNVTVDAAALCLKSGNAVILRGGKEALHTNQALADVVRDAAAAAGLDKDVVVFVNDTDKELLRALLQQSANIDLAIPRGGTALIDAVNEHARVPVIQHYQGICHVYVHAAADVDTAVAVVVNSKVSRPGVCNAAECVVVDRAIAATAVPRIVAALRRHNVEVRGDVDVCAIVSDVKAATAADFDTEFLALTMAMAVVDDEAAALAFLRRHGTHHTATIITRDHEMAMRFVRAVDASCVVVNASTRFNDGGELGLGAELGISTTKLHAYGPMGLEELCARKFVVLGAGETRGTP